MGSERRGPYATMGFNTTRVIHDWMQLATAMTSESEPSRGFGLRLCKKSSKIPNSVETFGGLAGGTWSVKRTHHGGRTKLSWYCIICQSNLVMETHTHTHSYTCLFSNMGFSLTWLVRWRGLISPSSNRCQAVKQRPSICDMQIQP